MSEEFDFVGSTVVCEVCRKSFELYENDLFRCEECGGKSLAYKKEEVNA